MTHRYLAPAGATLVVLSVGAVAVLHGDEPRPTTAKSKPRAAAKADSPPRKYATLKVRGKVVWLDAALQRLYGVATEPAVAETAVVLETPEGQLLPIVPDTRGRAFQLDARLRDIELELLVRRYEGVPMIQVIRVLRPKADGLYEIDYWCDICAIPMYLLKPCECCQGPTRLREQRVETPPAEARP